MNVKSDWTLTIHNIHEYIAFSCKKYYNIICIIIIKGIHRRLYIILLWTVYRIQKGLLIIAYLYVHVTIAHCVCYVPYLYCSRRRCGKIWCSNKGHDWSQTEQLGSPVGGGRCKAGLQTCVDRPNWIDMFYIHINDVGTYNIVCCIVVFGSISEEEQIIYCTKIGPTSFWVAWEVCGCFHPR